MTEPRMPVQLPDIGRCAWRDVTSPLRSFWDDWRLVAGGSIRKIRRVLKNLHLYPDGNAFYLKQKLAGKIGVETTNVILGNGSNEINEFVGHAFMGPGGVVGTA